jgi:hypothetical protein
VSVSAACLWGSFLHSHGKLSKAEHAWVTVMNRNEVVWCTRTSANAL